MRLASRVTLALTGVAAAVLLASFSVVLVLVSRDELRDLDRSLFLQAQASADRAMLRSAEHPRISEGDAHVPERISSITRYVCIYEADGTPSSFSFSFLGAPPSLPAFGVALPPPLEGATVDLTANGVALRGVLLPLGDRGQVILFAVSRHTIDEDLQFLWRLAVVVFVCGVSLTALLGRWISARISRDVETIAGVTRAVADGDLAARVENRANGTTETAALAADVDRMVHQLASSIDSQRTFVSHAAHELRSPLATIRGELQLALRRERSADEYKEAIAGVLTDVQSLSALSEQLLVLARVQALNNAPRSLEFSSLDDVLNETLHSIRATAREHGVHVVVEPHPSARSHDVRGARGDLARALRNLVDNAIVHSPPGARVRLELETMAERIRVAVVDTGPGVPSQDIPYLFDPFFRGSKEQSGEHAGAGLGLVIARDIARANGGELRFESREGPGSRFVLELPLLPEEPSLAAPD